MVKVLEDLQAAAGALVAKREAIGGGVIATENAIAVGKAQVLPVAEVDWLKELKNFEFHQKFCEAKS